MTARIASWTPNWTTHIAGCPDVTKWHCVASDAVRCSGQRRWRPFVPPWDSLGPGKVLQHLNRYGNHVGAVPRRRDAYHIGHETHCAGDECRDDGHDPAVAIEHGRSRGTVVEHETVISIVHLEECR